MKIYAPDSDVFFSAQFLASGVAATGLTVTVDVYKDGVSILADQAASEVGTSGLYKFVLDGANTDDPAIYDAVFVTAGTADQKRIKDTAQISALVASVAAIETSVGTIETSVGGDLTGDTDDIAADVATIKSVIRDYPGVNLEDLLNYTPVGAHLSDSLGAGVLSPSNPSRADGVWVSTLTQNVYYTLNGTTPTSTNGFLLVAGAAREFIPITPNTDLKFLRASAGAVLQRQYVRIVPRRT